MYYFQETRNNFDAMRPAPVCSDVNQMGQSQNVHVSTNCYYGFHDLNSQTINVQDNDYEMTENKDLHIEKCTRKRGASEAETPPVKRHRQATEVQTEKVLEPETIETKNLDEDAEALLETLLWNTHGGNIFHLIQCL